MKSINKTTYCNSNKLEYSSVLLILLAMQIIKNAYLSIFSALLSLIMFLIFLFKGKNKRIELLNIRFYFAILLYFYINTLPIFYFLFHESHFIFNFKLETILLGLRLSNGAYTLFIFFSIFTNKYSKSVVRYKRIEKYLKQFRMPKPLIYLFDLILIYYFVDQLFFIIKIGGLAGVMGGAREEILSLQNARSNQSIPVILTGMLLAYTFLNLNYFFRAWSMKKSINGMAVFRAILLVIYWGLVVLMGERVNAICIIMMAGLCFVIYAKKIRKRAIALALICIFLFASIGYFRIAGYHISGLFSKQMLSMSLGEFLMPIQSLFYFIENKEPLKYGATYLNIILYFIPRSIFPNKPIVLSHDIAYKMKTGFSTLLIPVLEGYFNFGNLTVVFTPLLFHILFKLFEKNSSKYPLIYLVPIACIFQLIRFDLAFFFLLSSGTFIGIILLSFFQKRNNLVSQSNLLEI